MFLFIERREGKTELPKFIHVNRLKTALVRVLSAPSAKLIAILVQERHVELMLILVLRGHNSESLVS